MKSFPITLAILITTALSCFSQQTWTNYTNDRLIADILVDGNEVWVGSQGGLTRTNIETGEFKTYLAGNSQIKGGGISEIEKAPDGSMWFGSENAGVFRLYQNEWTQYYNGIVDSVYRTIEGLQILPNGDVWFFIQKPNNHYVHKMFRIRGGEIKSFDGLTSTKFSFCVVDESTLYMAGDNAIYKYDVNTSAITETYNADNSILESTDKLWDIRLAKDGALIIPSTTRILQLLSGNLTQISQPGLEVNRSFSDDEGNIYFQPYKNNVNKIRLLKYDGNQLTYYKDQDFAPLPVGDAPFFSGADVATGLYGLLFNVQSEFTLYRFDAQGWHPVKSQIVPLLDNYQNDVQSDCHGNLWFSSRDGIDVRYANGTWGNFTLPTLPFTYFLSNRMTVDPTTCDVWFNNASNSGDPIIPGIIRIANGVVTGFLYGHANVYDIKASADGKIYFFSDNSGFGYIQNDEVHMIDEMQEFPFATSIDIDSKGNIYLACWNSQLIRYDGSSFTHLGSGEGGDYVFEVIVDNDDLVWAITSNGLMQFDGVNWHNFNQEWTNVKISDLVQDKKGNYWVTTYHDGLFYWNGQSTQHYDIFNSGLTTNTLYNVNLDPHGNLIVTQNVGASVLEIPELLEYYRGSGTVFFDSDKNGSFDSGSDVLVPGQKVKNLSNNLWSVTNPSGRYVCYSDIADESLFLHELDAHAESTTANPQMAAFVNYSSVLPDFGFWTDVKPNVQLSLHSGVMICGRDFNVQISLQNKSVLPVHGDLVFNYNDQLSFISSSLPPSVESSDQLTFHDVSLQPFEWENIKLTFKAPQLIGQGMALDFESVLQTLDSMFSVTTTDSVRCSYDPNDKKVEPIGDFFDHTSLLSDPLKYTIRFENEGNYMAFDIIILDTLDARLDPSTFELLASSHEVETTISPEGIVKFVFSHINLPARSGDEVNSQGFVSFTIKPDSTLTSDQSIFNKAGIYFDFNLPIQTNTTVWNLTDDLSTVGIKELSDNISIYPNPSDGHFIIETIMESTYQLWDYTGKFIGSGQLDVGRNTIQFNIHSGLYILQMTDKNGKRVVKKIVKL